MTPGARIQEAIELLQAIDAAPKAPADRVASSYFRSRRYVGAKDRAAIQGVVYDVLRRRAQLDWWLTRVEIADPSPRGRVLACLAKITQWPGADIEAAFSGARHAPPRLTPEESQALRRLTGGRRPADVDAIDHPDQPAEIRGNVPGWIAPALSQAFGDRLGDELRALLEPATVDLRVNALKTTRDEALSRLRSEGVTAEPTSLSPLGLRLVGRRPLGETGSFKDGIVEVQDEGSQLVALLVDAKPGMRVVDFCAGAGGKALAIAAGMDNKGHVVACDVSAKRLEASGKRLRRAGVHNVERKLLEDESDKWVKRHKHAYDRVLVDAPCTGIGTWRRNPDGRWSLDPKDLEELVPKQARILASAARLVKPGGRLVYATCSLLPAENERQVEGFLAAHPDFAPVPLEALWPAVGAGPVPCAGPYLHLTPARHGTDGFFAAVLERKSTQHLVEQAPRPASGNHASHGHDDHP
ncbi:MAG: RsmB/NOP family class I SAM-dependent RNA methyltransferase [Rhodospirillales bacterium]|nr:RsmB/NOP family class I SAM-dependent RNA methyltransferase [Rhodospirillales bacterium]